MYIEDEKGRLCWNRDPIRGRQTVGIYFARYNITNHPSSRLTTRLSQGEYRTTIETIPLGNVSVLDETEEAPRTMADGKTMEPDGLPAGLKFGLVGSLRISCSTPTASSLLFGRLESCRRSVMMSL